MTKPLTVEERGFMFPGVFDGPAWATFPTGSSGTPNEPRGHVAEIEVADTDRLGDALDIAASDFGIALSKHAREVHPDASVSEIIDGVAFRMAGDDAEEWLSKLRFVRRLPVLDVAGQLQIVAFGDAEVGALRRAAVAGLIDGDVDHPYLRPTVPGGAFGWIASEWDHIALAYLIIKEVIDGVGRGQTLYGVVRQGATFLQTLLRGPQTVKSAAAGLTERGIRPNELESILDRRDWALRDVAQLLGMPESEASQFLTVLGYESDDDGTWRTATSEPGLVTRAAINVLTNSDFLLEEAARARIAFSVEYVLERGEMPPLEKVFDDSVWSWPENNEGDEGWYLDDEFDEHGEGENE